MRIKVNNEHEIHFMVYLICLGSMKTPKTLYRITYVFDNIRQVWYHRYVSIPPKQTIYLQLGLSNGVKFYIEYIGVWHMKNNWNKMSIGNCIVYQSKFDIGTRMFSNVETSLSQTCLISGLGVSNIPILLRNRMNNNFFAQVSISLLYVYAICCIDFCGGRWYLKRMWSI